MQRTHGAQTPLHSATRKRRRNAVPDAREVQVYTNSMVHHKLYAEKGARQEEQEAQDIITVETGRVELSAPALATS